MKTKMLKLVKILFESSTATNLANSLDVSVRTVKTYIHTINEDFPNAIASSYNGYKINPSIAIEILKGNYNSIPIPQTSDERVTYIINKLINHNNILINSYDLCDDMYISLSTLKNELIKVKRRLKPFDLELITKGDFIEVKGLEKSKRKLLCSILYDESNINLETLQNNFVNVDISFLKKSILDFFEENRYYINDFSLMSLVLHIAIAIDRIRNGNCNEQTIDNILGVCLHEYNLAQNLAIKIENHFNIKFTKSEIYELSQLIVSRTTTLNYKYANITNLKDFIGQDCFNLVNQLIQSINKSYNINISKQEFLTPFALHIRNLLVRSKNNCFCKNPLTDEIKTNCPLIYDISVFLASTIKKATGFFITDDEIAYIALHLACIIGAQKNLTTKLNIVLFCPNYYEMKLKIIYNIQKYFINDLLITNILTDECELSKINDIDFIVTTISLSKSKVTLIPVVQIALFFNENDRLQILNMIEYLRKEKRKNKFEACLHKIIIPEFFEKVTGIRTENDCINYMADKMVKHGYVKTTFKDEIFERERMSSTAFKNFAIPHTMKLNAKKTGINIITSEEEILWNCQPVNIILMMSFNKNERHIFNEIFEYITMILIEKNNVKKLIACNNYNDFIKVMVSML